MTRAIPEYWIERLFARMEAIYAARFHDFWRNVDDFDAVKRIWREGLADMSDADLRRGVAALFHTRPVPDLPAFRDLCRPAPRQFTTQPPHECLTDQRQQLTSEGEAQLERIKAMTKKAFLPDSPRADGIAWAYRLLANAEKGHAVNAMQIAFAHEAIRSYETTHQRIDAGNAAGDELELPQRVPSPHIYTDEPRQREPGDDDEEIAA